MPWWRNGRRRGLKIPRSKGHAGSSPAQGTVILLSRMDIMETIVFGHKLGLGGGFSSTSKYIAKTSFEQYVESYHSNPQWQFNPDFVQSELNFKKVLSKSRGHDLGSLRWKIFKDYPFCVFCRIPITHVILWEQPKGFKPYHLDAASNHKNEWVMFTIDHHIPRSKGGSDDVSNLQPSCYRCNIKKGNDMLEPAINIFAK